MFTGSLGTTKSQPGNIILAYLPPPPLGLSSETIVDVVAIGDAWDSPGLDDPVDLISEG